MLEQSASGWVTKIIGLDVFQMKKNNEKMKRLKKFLLFVSVHKIIIWLRIKGVFAQTSYSDALRLTLANAYHRIVHTYLCVQEFAGCSSVKHNLLLMFPSF